MTTGPGTRACRTLTDCTLVVVCSKYECRVFSCRDFRRKRHHRPHPPFRPGHRLHREGRGPPDDDHDGIPRHSLDYADSIEIIDPNKAFPFYEYISDVGDPDFFGLHRVRDHGRLNAVDRPKFRPGFLLLPKGSLYSRAF